MNDQIGMSFSRVDDLAVAIAGANEAIAGELDRLEREVAANGSDWTGEAAAAYELAHRQWASAAREMNRVLAETQRATLAITERHRAAEAQARALWK